MRMKIKFLLLYLLFICLFIWMAMEQKQQLPIETGESTIELARIHVFIIHSDVSKNIYVF